MNDDADTFEEIHPDDSGAIPVASQDPKTRRTFSRIALELSTEELSSPGVQKLIVEELGRCQATISELEQIRFEFHKTDKDLAIEREKNNKNIGVEIISSGCLAVAGAILGYAPSLTSLPAAGYVAFAFGVLLTFIGVVAKIILLK